MQLSESTVAELSSTWKNEGLSSNEIDSRLNKYNFDPGMRNTGTLPKATAGEIGIKSKIFSRVHLCILLLVFISSERICLQR